MGIAELSSFFPKDKIEPINFLPQQGKPILILCNGMIDIAIISELTVHFLDLIDKLFGFSLQLLYFFILCIDELFNPFVFEL